MRIARDANGIVFILLTPKEKDMLQDVVSNLGINQETKQVKPWEDDSFLETTDLSKIDDFLDSIIQGLGSPENTEDLIASLANNIKGVDGNELSDLVNTPIDTDNLFNVPPEPINWFPPTISQWADLRAEGDRLRRTVQVNINPSQELSITNSLPEDYEE